MSTIMVTGVAGFIGSRTASLLLDREDRVIGLDNMNNYYDVKLKEYRLSTLREWNSFTFQQVDIEDREKLESIFARQQIDAVVNLAARAGVRYSMENPHIYMSTNAQGTLNLLEMIRKHGIRKMVLASTSSLYAGQAMPFSEALPVNTPISPYAASKKAAEAIAYTYHYLYGIDVSVLRYFTVYGPAGRPDMSIFRFIKWIAEELPVNVFGDGTQSRDFTFISDIAEGTVKALKNVGYEIINLGGGKNPVSINYIIAKIEKLLGKKATIKYQEFHRADLKETWADIQRANDLLNWKPKMAIDEGLRECVDWYNQNRSWLYNLKV